MSFDDHEVVRVKRVIAEEHRRQVPSVLLPSMLRACGKYGVVIGEETKRERCTTVMLVLAHADSYANYPTSWLEHTTPRHVNQTLREHLATQYEKFKDKVDLAMLRERADNHAQLMEYIADLASRHEKYAARVDAVTVRLDLLLEQLERRARR
jgi:hypothetical protein